MNQEALLCELADILGATAPLTWDSMALLAYLAFLRFRFNITLPGTSCATFHTVADLLAPIPPQA